MTKRIWAIKKRLPTLASHLSFPVESLDVVAELDPAKLNKSNEEGCFDSVGIHVLQDPA